MINMTMTKTPQTHMSTNPIVVFGCRINASTVRHCFVAVDDNGDVHAYTTRPTYSVRLGRWIGVRPILLGTLDVLDDSFDSKKLFVVNHERGCLEEI